MTLSKEHEKYFNTSRFILHCYVELVLLILDCSEIFLIVRDRLNETKRLK